ncbi:MAG: tetratricopeptide repeat protein, partial [Desulfobacterales bacterium]|nr:tetratricopeptide repeat protein [Desulfobacterales bacterium]
AAYDKVIAEHPYDIVAKNGRAEVLKALNRLDEALDAYDKIIDEYSYEIIPKAGRAEVLKTLNRLDEALDAYDKIIAEHPYDVIAKHGRAEVLKALNRLDKALAAYDKVIAEHPYDIVAKNGRACVLAAMEREDEALLLLPDKNIVTKEEWIGYHIRGMILLRKGELDLATQIFEEGVRDNPRPADRDYFRTALAVAHLHEREYKPASNVLDEITNPMLQIPANILRIHAFGRRGNCERTAEIYKALPSKPGPVLAELQSELHCQYVACETPHHSEDWLIDKEIHYILLAA